MKAQTLSKLTKEYWQQHPPETCEQIIAHAGYRASRGKRPSMTVGKHRNPRKLLALAKKTLAEDERQAKYADERARVRDNADRMSKVWLGYYDGRNHGNSRLYRRDDNGFCRISEDLARLGGNENEWSLYIVHVQKVDPVVGFSMGSSGFMPEVRPTGSNGPEGAQRIFGPTDWRGWETALGHGKALLREKIEFMRQVAERRKAERRHKRAPTGK